MGKHYGISGHATNHVFIEGVRRGNADENIGAPDGLGQPSFDLLRIGAAGDVFFIGIHALSASLPDSPPRIAHDDIFQAKGHEQLDDGNAGGPCTTGNNSNVVQFFVYKLEGVDKPGQSDNRCAVLVVMKNRASENAIFFQTVFDDKAFWSLDVFKVDATKGGRHKLHQLYYFCSVLGIHANGKSVHIAKGFEQQRLAFHNGHCGGGADVA